MANLQTTMDIAMALKPLNSEWVGLGYKEKEAVWSQIFTVDQTSDRYEVETSMSHIGLLAHKPEGTAFASGELPKQGFKTYYEPLVFGRKFAISREAIDDNKYIQLSKQRAMELGRAARETKEHVCHAIINNGADSAYPTSDGVELFSTAHIDELNGTFSNKLATDVDLSELALEQMCIEIFKMQDSAGKYIRVAPEKLIIHPINIYNVERILGSTLQASTANNAINAMKAQGVLQKGVVVSNYLADENAFYILTDIPNGLKVKQRDPIEITTDIADADTESIMMKVRERFASNVSDVRCIFASLGA